jgi:hypothetical protein
VNLFPQLNDRSFEFSHLQALILNHSQSCGTVRLWRFQRTTLRLSSARSSTLTLNLAELATELFDHPEAGFTIGFREFVSWPQPIEFASKDGVFVRQMPELIPLALDDLEARGTVCFVLFEDGTRNGALRLGIEVQQCEDQPAAGRRKKPLFLDLDVNRRERPPARHEKHIVVAEERAFENKEFQTEFGEELPDGPLAVEMMLIRLNCSRNGHCPGRDHRTNGLGNFV